MEISGIEEFIATYKKYHSELGKIINPILEKYDLPDKEVLEVCQIGKFVYEINSEIKILEKPQPPDPDFIIEYESKIIGLEHTRIYTDNAENYNRIASLIDYSEKLFASKFPDEKIHAQISIVDDKMDFKKSEKRNLANQIVEYIFNLSKGLNLNRPTFISNLLMSTHSQVSFTYLEKKWHAPYLTKERLGAEIQKKETRLEHYKKGRPDISEYWLVLFIGSLSSVSYQFNRTEKYATESTFDRVYLMTDFDAEITRVS